MQRLPLLAVGDLLVVLVATVTAAYHLTLFWLWPEARDRFWAGVIALGTAIYAGAAAALYATTDFSMAAPYQRLIIVGGAVICHAIPPYLASLEGRALGREARFLWISFVAWTVILLFSPWVFNDAVVPFDLDWHDAPYPQPGSGPLNELCYLALLAVAIRPVLRAAWNWKRRSRRIRAVVAITIFWVFLAAYDGIMGLGWIPNGPAFFLEYGLLLLALFLFADSVTEHARLLRQAVKDRSAAEEAFELLARGSPDPILLIRDEEVVFANDATAQMMGLSSAYRVMNRPLAHLIHSDDLEVFARPPDDEDQEDAPARHTIRFRREDLTLATAVLAVAPVVVAGKPALLAIARDVSEEQALRAKVMSFDRMIAVGTLAAGVAHEINNPLTYVRANLEVLADLLAEVAPDRATSGDAGEGWEPVIADARHGVERIASIVTDLRDTARFSDSDDPIPQHLSEVLETVLRLTRRQMEDRAVVETDIRTVPPVMAAPGRLSQVFINLLNNAVEALPEGRTTQHRIFLQAHEDGGDAVVTIEDDGPGMEPHTLRRIFDPFYTTKGIGEGTGLGLFICRRIVTGCGGTIEVRSAPGEGTRFTVRLPSIPI